jgi:hypothetical protein
MNEQHKQAESIRQFSKGFILEKSYRENDVAQASSLPRRQIADKMSALHFSAMKTKEANYGSASFLSGCLYR